MYYHPNVRFVGVVGPFEMIKKKIIRDIFFIQTETRCIGRFCMNIYYIFVSV